MLVCWVHSCMVLRAPTQHLYGCFLVFGCSFVACVAVDLRDWQPL